MRLSTKALLGAIAALALSHIIAVTTESQIAAQTSWILIWVVIAFALVAFGDVVYHWSRRSIGR